MRLLHYLVITLAFPIALMTAWNCHAELAEDQAFNLQVRITTKSTLELYWEIAPNHYLYKSQLAILDANNVSLLQPNTLPEGTIVHDKAIGDYTVYSNRLLITLPWTSKLLVRYQGCAKDGFCYLPISKEVIIDEAKHISIAASSLQSFPQDSATDQLAELIKNRFLPLTLLLFFGLGILLSFTPCVLPMIPLVVNLIIGPKPLGTHKSALLACSYVVGMAGSYTVAGVVAGMLGATLQVWLQQPWVLISMSILLIVLALSQLDIIHFTLPHFNSRLHKWSERQLQGSMPGAFFLGIISALIVSPCITPPLIGALTYISQHGSPFIGGLTLLSLGLGMGVPLVVVALLSNMILPKAGAWMNVIKSLAGVALLGLAIWLLARILAENITQMLWGALCIFTAILLKAFAPMRHIKLSQKVVRFIGIVIAIYGGMLIWQAAQQEFSAKQHIAVAAQPHWQNIDTIAQLDAALATAKLKQQVTLLEFYADWCTSCQKIEANVFTDPEIIRALANLHLLRVDMTNLDPKQKELLQRLEIYGPPVLVFFAQDGTEIKNERVVGEISAQQLLELLRGL